VSEAAFQRQVMDLAEIYGWLVFHPADNRPSAHTDRVQNVVPGFPDLVLVRGACLAFVELKTDKGKVRQEQRDWLDAFSRVAEGISDLARAAYGTARLAGLGVPIPGEIPSVHAFVWRPRDFDVLRGFLKSGDRQWAS
jgi:hypothetical protein